MFDFDRAISDWRRQMAAGGIKTPEVLDELESHLREDVDQQVRSGVRVEQAFATAATRLGQATMLKAEFEKVGAPASGRLKVIAFAGFGLYLAAAAYALMTHDLSAVEMWLGFAALALTLLTCLALPWAAKRVQAEGRRRTVIEVSSAVFGLGWLTSLLLWIVPQLEFTTSRLVVGLLWAFIPTIAAGAFALGLEPPRLRLRSVGVAWSLGLLASLSLTGLTGCLNVKAAAQSPQAKLLQEAEQYVSEQRAQDKLPGWRSTEHGRDIASAPWRGGNVSYPAWVIVRAWKAGDESTYWYELVKDTPESSWRLVEATHLDKHDKVIEPLFPKR